MFSARDGDLATATAALNGRGIAITGAAGVGKTALARAVAAKLDQHHTCLVWLAASEASRQLPFGALAPLVPATTSPDATTVLPAVRDALREKARRRRLVMVVDDAHLLDGPSAALVVALTPHARLMVTARSGQPRPDAVTSLWKDGYLERLDLMPFDRSATADLLAGQVGGEVAGPTVDLLHQWTRGNALFLVELVGFGLRGGAFRQESGLWWWRAPLLVPPVMSELLDRQVRDLGGSERDALAAVALSEPVSMSVLERVVPAEVVVHLEDRGLLRTDDPGGWAAEPAVSFRHPMLGAAVRRRLSAARRRRAAAMLLDAHAESVVQPRDVVQRATWQLESRRGVEPGLLIRAADALLHVDPARAREMSEEALRRDPSASVAIGHAQSLVEVGEVAEARTVLEAAAERATDPAEQIHLAVALAGQRAWAERDPSGGYSELAALLATVTEPGARSEIISVTALARLFAGRAPDALDLAEEVLADAAAQPAARLRARLTQGAALTLVGRTREALAASESAARQAIRGSVGLPYAPGMAMAAIALAQLWREPISDLPTTHPATGRWPVPAYRLIGGTQPTTWPLFDGYTRRVAGDLAGATDRLREALVQQSGGEGLFRSEAAAWLTLCLAEAGKLDEAADVLRSTPPDDMALVPGLMPWASAGLADARGDKKEAIRQVNAAVAEARRSRCRLVELGYLCFEAELRGFDGSAAIAPRIRQLLEEVDAPRLVVSAMATLALIEAESGQPGQAISLLGHVGALEGMGLLKPALIVAEAAESRGDPEARAHADRLRGVLGLTPVGTRPELTARESEVVTLAADGMSDREIAERLVLSVRTVESHLSRAYRKLQVSSRRELTGVLRAGHEPPRIR
ncbi:MAG: LuxR C-terminal-related transcriptional regulator [Nocardioides sp.]